MVLACFGCRSTRITIPGIVLYSTSDITMRYLGDCYPKLFLLGSAAAMMKTRSRTTLDPPAAMQVSFASRSRDLVTTALGKPPLDRTAMNYMICFVDVFQPFSTPWACSRWGACRWLFFVTGQQILLPMRPNWDLDGPRVLLDSVILVI